MFEKRIFFSQCIIFWQAKLLVNLEVFTIISSFKNTGAVLYHLVLDENPGLQLATLFLLNISYSARLFSRYTVQEG